MRAKRKNWIKFVNGLGYALVDAVSFAFLLMCVIFVLFVSGLIFVDLPMISANLLTLGMMSVLSFAWLYYRIVGGYK